MNDYKKPRVTELINLLDKPGLMKWANKIGLEGIRLEDYRKKSTEKGTSLHKQIENYILHSIPFEDPFHQAMFDLFIYDKQVIDLEQQIETKWFVGRYDAKIRIGEDIYICDFKSTTTVYFENKLQLSAYRMAFPECKIAVVEIPSFIFKPIDICFKDYEDIMKALSFIHQKKSIL